jgi:probable HAF family extracellular repeat protein
MGRTVTVLSLAAVLLAGLALIPQLRAQALPQVTGQIRYKVIDLGTLGGTFGYAGGLNNLGSVTGGATLPGDTAQHAYLWRKGRMTDLGTFGGPDSDAPFPPNDFNQVAGAAETATADPLGEDVCGFGTGLTCIPFLWQNGKMTPLPLLGGNNGLAFEINNWGVIAGTSENTTQDSDCQLPQKLQFQPVYWSRGKIYRLPILPGDTAGQAVVINDFGQIAGQSGICSRPGLHAVFWQNGRAIDMGNLGGTRGNVPGDINNWGQVVGRSRISGDVTAHAFLWDKHLGMKDLGTLPADFFSTADGINDLGQVVGASCDINFNCRAFLWENGVMTDLNTLIPAGSSLYLVDATGTINNAGEIAGSAVDINSGEGHPFLLVPCGKGDILAGCDDNPQSATAASAQPRRVVIPENIRQMLRQHAGEKPVFPGLTTPLR